MCIDFHYCSFCPHERALCLPCPAKELFVIPGVTLKFHFTGLPRQYGENRKY